MPLVVAFNVMTINHDGVISGHEIKLKPSQTRQIFPADDMRSSDPSNTRCHRLRVEEKARAS